MDGKSICNMSADEFKKKSRQLISRAKEELQKYKGNCEISQFSPWFSEFTTEHSSNNIPLGHKLLVPGMAVAGSEASCVHDVEIVGFGKTVTIFSSKQKPKKLTIYAANFATHEFIVKVRNTQHTDFLPSSENLEKCISCARNSKHVLRPGWGRAKN